MLNNRPRNFTSRGFNSRPGRGGNFQRSQNFRPRNYSTFNNMNEFRNARTADSNHKLDIRSESKINYEDWKDSIYSDAKGDCPLVVTILKGNPIEVPTEPERTNLRTEADKFKYQNDLRNFTSKQKEIIDQKAKLCSKIWKSISITIKNYIEAKDPNAEINNDIENILKYIKQAYYNTSNHSEKARKDQAEKTYQLLTQNPDELTTTWKNRFSRTYIACTEQGMDKKTESVLAYDFIKKLDSIRFAGMQAEMANEDAKKQNLKPEENIGLAKLMGYPETLNDAFDRSMSYKIPVTKFKGNGNVLIPASNFTTAAFNKKGKNNNFYNNNNTNTRNTTHNRYISNNNNFNNNNNMTNNNIFDYDKLKPTDKPSDYGKGTCNGCGGDHFRKFCPT